jgi:hypothetical protein
VVHGDFAGEPASPAVGHDPDCDHHLISAPPRAGLALEHLRRLADRGPDEARWWHWVVGDDSSTVRGVSRERTLILQRSGLGAPTRLDERGRLVLPVWLRALVAVTGTVLVAARQPEPSLVVITPTSVLDALVDDVAVALVDDAGEVG